MIFDNFKENIEGIQENTKAYIETSISYYKLFGFKVSMKLTTLLLKLLIVTVCVLFFLVFISIAASLALGDFLNNYPLGFLYVGLFYFVMSIILYFLKNKFIERPILEKFSKIFFND